MFLKRLVFFIVIFGLFSFIGIASAATPIGVCNCLNLLDLNAPEEVFDSTQSVCEQKVKPLEKACVWDQIGEAGCYCDTCTTVPLAETDYGKRIDKTQTECSGDLSIGPMSCKNCVWYDPGLDSGCFCDLTVLNRVARIYTTFTSDKCKGDVKVETVFPITYKNCIWKNKTPPPSTSTDGSAGGGTSAGSTVSGGTSGFSSEPAQITVVNLENPLGAGRTDVRLILGDIIKTGLGILGSLTLLVFIYGGFLWLISAGNQENIKKGTQTMLWAVIGIFIIFASYGILSLVLNAIGTKGSPDAPWGVGQGSIQGYTNQQVQNATEQCYCYILDSKSGSPGKCRELVPMTEGACKQLKNVTDQAQGVADCEWQEFQSCNP